MMQPDNLRFRLSPNPEPVRFASKVHGYAVRAADTVLGPRDKAAYLVTDQLFFALDYPERKELLPGEFAEVLPGSIIPLGANCVVPSKFVHPFIWCIGGQSMAFTNPTKPGDNIRPASPQEVNWRLLTPPRPYV